MGKIKVIKKSRKECTCGKCRTTIPVGSTYYRGTLNFHPDIIRCKKCGLQSWEVTTSDYQLSVGEIVNRWQENYGVDESSVDSIREELDAIRDDLQDRLDNMPENLQYSDTGELLQSRIDSLEYAIGELECIDTESIKSDIEEDEENNRFEEELTEAIENALSNIEY